MSIKLDELQMILNAAGVKDAALKSAIIKEAEDLEASKKEERTSGGPKLKNKLTVLIRTDDPSIKKFLENQAAFIVKTPETLDENTIVNRITVAAARQNQSVKKKGRIATFADYFKFIKGKHRKTDDTNVLNAVKEPVRIVVLDTEDIPFSPTV